MNTTNTQDPTTVLQALEALDELEASARGDEPFNHFAGPLIRSFLEAALQPAAAQPQGDAREAAEAWRKTPCDNGWHAQSLAYKLDTAFQAGAAWQAASTQASEPLTDEQIIEHFKEAVDTGSLSSFADGVRYAERAHGITTAPAAKAGKDGDHE